MAKSKSARGGRKRGKAAKRSAKQPIRKKKVQKKARPSRKTVQRRAKTSKAGKTGKAGKKKASARKKAPAMKPRRKKAPGRKPAAPKARGKKPVKQVRPVKQARPAKKRAPAKPAEPPRKTPALNRERKRLVETDEDGPTAPSTLGYEGGASAARSGRSEMREARTQHTETGPALTGGDVDADWEDAYAVGDEAPGGDNPTPDQDRVDDIGKALGVQYNDNEELKGSDKIIERDRHRWELDPASSDDYNDRSREE